MISANWRSTGDGPSNELFNDCLSTPASAFSAAILRRWSADDRLNDDLFSDGLATPLSSNCSSTISSRRPRWQRLPATALRSTICWPALWQIRCFSGRSRGCGSVAAACAGSASADAPSESTDAVERVGSIFVDSVCISSQSRSTLAGYRTLPALARQFLDFMEQIQVFDVRRLSMIPRTALPWSNKQTQMYAPMIQDQKCLIQASSSTGSLLQEVGQMTLRSSATGDAEEEERHPA